LAICSGIKTCQVTIRSRIYKTILRSDLLLNFNK
jgi:hypothetical protein